MRKCAFILFCAVLVAGMSGCAENKSRAVEGGVIGGVIGAGLGSIIGHQSGETGEGAAVGAAVGAIAGSIAGAQMEKNPGSNTQGAMPAQNVNPNQMTIAQIVELTGQGVDERVIIDRIRLTSSRFALSPAQIDYLRQQGVSNAVISAMQGY